MGFRARAALLVTFSVLLVAGYARVSDDPAGLVADTATAAPTGEEAEHDHHCPDRGRQTDTGWVCDVTHARLVSQYPFDQRPTASQVEEAERFAAEVEQAAKAFADVEAARAAGYAFDDRRAWMANVQGTPLQDTEAEVLAAGSIAHLVNAEHANDGVALDAEHPDALMYATDGDDYVLVGAMFIAPVETDGPQIGGPLTTWHVHTQGDVVCWDRSAAVGFARLLPGDDRYEPSGGCERGAAREVTPQMLHVWFDAPSILAAYNDEMSNADAADRLR